MSQTDVTERTHENAERITRVETKVDSIETKTDRNSEQLDEINTKLDKYTGALTLSYIVMGLVGGGSFTVFVIQLL